MKPEEEAMMMIMMMENNINAEVESSTEEEGEIGGSSTPPPQIAKRKRTKRLRIGGLSAGGSSNSDDHRRKYESSVTTTTGEEEEEADMANCLILLARGGRGRSGSRGNDAEVVFDEVLKTAEISRKPKKNKMETVSSVHSRLVNDTNTANGNSVVYECRTCDKAFQSFQALGGHRASHHKKPKLFADDHAKVNPTSTTTSIIHKKPSFAAAATHSNSKAHECSICGSAFSSGQALGGHMRRHRSSSAVTLGNNDDDNRMAAAAAVAIDAQLLPAKVAVLLVDRYNNNTNNNNFLASLDLNLPAPADEELQNEDEMSHGHNHRRRLFIHQQLATAGQNSSNPASTTAPPLVGCYF